MKTNATAILFLLASAISFTAKSQCTISVTPQGPTTFCAGGSVQLNALASGSGSETLDQQQLLYQGGESARNLPGYSAWQSFTAGITGSFDRLDQGFFNPMTGTATLRIFSGTGNSGTLLYTAPITISGTGNFWNTFIISPAVSVTAGQVYTCEIVPVQGGGLPDPYGVQVAGPADTYTGGQCEFGPTWDDVFKTYVSGGAGGTFTYNWSNGATTQNILVTSSGSYTVTATDAGNCTVISSPVTVTVNPVPATPTITPDGNLTFCEGDDVMLTSSSATNNHWSNGASSQSISVSSAGTFTDTVSNNFGCTAVSAPIAVTVHANPPTPVITADGSTSFCEGDTVELMSNAATNNHWSNSETTQSISVSSSGTFTDTVSNSFGCAAVSTTITVTVNPNPSTPTITPDGSTTFCMGDSVMLTSSAAAGYQWSNSSTTQSVTIFYSGAYFDTIYNGFGCNAISAPITVTVNPIPSANVTADGSTTFCQGDSVTLISGSSTNNNWSDGESTQSIIVTNSGSYTDTVSNGLGCFSVSAPEIVTVNPTPVTPIISQTGFVLTSNAGTGNQWFVNDSLIAGANNSSYTVPSPVTSHQCYSVEVTNNFGCSAESDTICFYPLISGINEIGNNDFISVFPNPSQGNFKITVPTGSTKVEIFNSVSQLLQTQLLNGQTTLDLNLKQNGIYLIMVTTPKNIYAEKVIICK